MDETDPAEPDEDDRMYRYTIRTLYVAAIALNVWLLWTQVRGTPEAEIAKKQVGDWWKRMTKPARDQKLFRKHANEVIFEAMEIVDGK